MQQRAAGGDGIHRASGARPAAKGRAPKIAVRGLYQGVGASPCAGRGQVEDFLKVSGETDSEDGAGVTRPGGIRTIEVAVRRLSQLGVASTIVGRSEEVDRAKPAEGRDAVHTPGRHTIKVAVGGLHQTVLRRSQAGVIKLRDDAVGITRGIDPEGVRKCGRVD